MSFRTHGKASFADLADQSGRIQLYIRVDQVGEAKYEQFCKLDIGDVVAVYGRIFRTRRGEISVEVYDFLMMAKSLRPLPDKWYGLKDVEIRYRQRYLDLIVNPNVRKVFETRSRIIQALRGYLLERGSWK